MMAGVITGGAKNYMVEKKTPLCYFFRQGGAKPILGDMSCYHE